MKIQIVHTKQDDGSTTHHARVRADNHEIVWVTESYTRSETAWQAVELLDRLSMGDPVLGWAYPGRRRLKAQAEALRASGESGTQVDEVWE